MSNLWRLSRKLCGDGDLPPIVWPAEVELTFRLKPGDLFGMPDARAPRSSLVGKTEFSIDFRTGKYGIIETGNLPPFRFEIKLDAGSLAINGNVAYLKASAESEAHLVSLMHWTSAALTEFLSVQLGIFTEVDSLAGVVAGRKVDALYPAQSYSILLADLDAEFRDERVRCAFQGPSEENPSYPRFLVSTRYFHHALRFIAPTEVNYVPYSAHAEVLLNLAKAIEILFDTAKRDVLRKILPSHGYTTEQIESQILPILIVRNEIDVGHPTSGDVSPEDVAALRRFVDRSIKNVAAILQNVWRSICAGETVLKPLPGSGAADRAKLVAKLKAYLDEPPLDPGLRSPNIITAS